MTSEGEKMVGVRMTKSGEFWAEIKDPIGKRWDWIGVFGSAEEATRAYLSTAQQRVDSAVSENPSLQNSVPTKIVGVRRMKSGKFGVSIKDPFKKKKVCLGTFTTREEAYMAYLAKKAQFEAEQFTVNQRRIDDLTSFQQGARNKISGVRSRRGKFSAEIKDPTTKRRVWIGTFATQEEATRAYLAKEADFFERVASVYSSDQVSGEEAEAGFGIFHGVQVVDENGFLVGEFSVVDDLRIWSEEEDANS